MGLSKAKKARLLNLRKAKKVWLAKKLKIPGVRYEIKDEESEDVGVHDSIKVEVKEEPEDDEPEPENEDFYRQFEERNQEYAPLTLPSTSSTIPLSNRPREYRCLLCYKTSDNTDELVDCEEYNFRTMFLMKKIFDVPNIMLQDYLRTFGSAGTWVSVCKKCDVLVDKALGVQKKINQLEKSLRVFQKEMITSVKKSLTAVQLLGSSPKNNIIRVTNETRKYVFEGTENVGHHKTVSPGFRKFPRDPHPEAPPPAMPETSCTANVNTTNLNDVASPSCFNFEEFSVPVTTERSSPATAFPHAQVSVAGDNLFRNRPRKVRPTLRTITTLRNVTGEVLTMTRSSTYICILCPHLKEMPFQSFLIHVMFHHNRPFRCSECKVYYAHPKELEVSLLHEKQSNEDTGDGGQTQNEHHVCTVDTLVETKFKPKEVWTCDRCPRMFDLESEWESHEHQVHQNRILSELKYQCITCSKKYRNFDDWRLHRVLEHPEVAALSCHFCDEYFGEKSKEGVDVLLNRESRRAHVKKQHGKRLCCYDINACDHCGENFAIARQLEKHTQERHGLPPKKIFSCPICWVRFKNYTSVTSHLQSIHRAGYPEAYVCEICGYTVKYQSYLAQHNLVKHGIRPTNRRVTVHTCKSEGCKFESIYRNTFDKHMILVHGADRKHVCQFCGKGFLDPKHCREHEKIHTNKTSKPYKCEICGNSFALRNYLYIHMRLSHLNRPFASTHKKRPYRKRVTPKTTRSEPDPTSHCNEDLGSGSVESGAVLPT